MIHFTLYSRSYCHLCQDMLEQLQAALGDIVHTIEVIDIDLDGNEEQLARYDELVPVLLASRDGKSSQQLCHYFLDLASLHAFLEQARDA